jgi:hypothetical protein
MVDIAALVIVLLIVVIAIVHQTSAGIAILGLLAGVLLDQLLSGWVLGMIPAQSSTTSPYVPVVVHLLITFTPVAASLVAARTDRRRVVLSVLTSLVLGFLVVYFGLKIVGTLPVVEKEAKNSGLITFLSPYQNAILALSAILALAEMILGHRKKLTDKKKK